jgi:ligand-binding sensor domain-containing protein
VGWWWLALISGLAAARESTAAAPGWQVDRWSPADGLPLDHLNRVVVDGDGYVWVATFDGLSRFDGLGFDTYRRDRLPALRSNRVVGLVVDADGQLVFTDELGAVYRMDPAQPAPTVVLERGARGVLRSGAATWVYGDHAVWELVDGVAVERMVSPADEAHRADTAGADLDGGVVVQARGALMRVDRAGRTREVALPPWTGAPSSRRFDPPPAVDAAGRVWAVVEAALVVWEGAAVREVATDGAPCLAWRGSDGAVRVSAEGGVSVDGVARWSGRAACGEVAVADESEWVVRGGWLERDGLRLAEVGDPVPGMVSDGVGGVWVASHRGLLRVRPAVVTVLGDGPERRATDALAPDGRGGAWASVARALVRYDAAGAVVPTPPELADAIPATLRAATDGVRLVSRDRLLAVGADGAVRSEPLPPGVEAAPGAWWADVAGRTWLAWRDGLLSRAPGGPWQEVRPRGEPLVDVRDAVALPGGQVVLLVGRQGLFVGPPDDLRRRDDVGSVDLRAAWVDGGALYLGTEDAGLCRIAGDPLTAPAVCLDGAALGDHNVHHLLDDGRGRLWLGTNRGLRVVARSAVDAALDAGGAVGPLPVLHLDARDGLAPPEVNGGQWAAFRDGDGRLWVPTMGGPAVVDPGRLPDRAPPTVQLLGLWADGRPAPPDGHLPAAARELAARWSVPEHVRPDQVEVRYRLTGVDRGWRFGGREATWTSLPAGPHTLEVQARLGGDWGPTTRAAVWRAPTFVETRAFPLALVAGAAGATAGVAWWRGQRGLAPPPRWRRRSRAGRPSWSSATRR